MTPKLSIIMSIFQENTEQLQKSIDSILGQSFKDFEFIIILDNPDNSEAKKHIQNVQKIDDRITFIGNEKNIKLGASLNIGISNAQGKYIARMDGDDVCNLEKLNKQYEYLEKNKETDLLFTGWEQIDEKGKRELRIPKKADFKNISQTFFYKSPLLHASMMCKKSLFENHKYPEIDRPEDFSLFLDFIEAGYIFDIIPEALYTFHVDFLNQDKKYKKIRIFSENYIHILGKKIKIFWKNPYFWWMFMIIFLQWGLSRNKIIFSFLFEGFQNAYKKIFL